MHRNLLNQIVDAVVTSTSLREVLANTTELVGQAFGASRCVMLQWGSEREVNASPVEWTEEIPDPSLDSFSITLAKVIQSHTLNLSTPLLVADARTERRLSMVREEIELLNLRSILAVTTRFRGVPNGTIIIYSHTSSREWSSDEADALQYVAHFVGAAIYHTRKAAELTEERGLVGVAVGSSPAAIALYSLQGVLSITNRSFDALFGTTEFPLRGENYSVVIEQVVAAEDRERVRRGYDDIFSGQRPECSLEYRLRDRLDFRLVIESLAVVRDEQGAAKGFESVIIDVTEREAALDELRTSEARYRRLVEHSDAIIFNTDPDHGVTFISRRALDFFGVAPEDFIATERVRWFELVHPEDRERLVQSAREWRDSPSSFDEEFRVINRITGQTRWLLVRVVPVRKRHGELEGWDGFGIDITSRKAAQEALDLQSKKVRALYTVAAAIRGFLDPANIAESGLQALCDATGADAGVCYLFHSRSSELQLVAHHGFSPRFAQQVMSVGNFSKLSNYVAQKGQPIVVPDIRTDPRASRVLAEEEGIRSEVLVPICAEDETLGTLGLYSRATSRFDAGDVMLVSAAANQIGLAARQASLFAAYRKQTKNLAALYRMSHELTRNLSLDDMFLQAFTIIRDELGLKRLWLGLLNESGTRIVGQAAYGPGLRRRLAEINVELSDPENPIGRCVLTREPVTMANPSSVLREFGIKRIFSRLAIHSVVFVPLIASGQVVGVLAVQPSSEDATLDEEGITLLKSLTNEIAGVVLTKRFEERITESEKMRTSGLLAAGIAHNFNNLLQAILGQASLLEMQAETDPRVKRAAQLMNEAANKGAALVKQLMSFAHLERPMRETCDVNYLIEVVLDSFRSMFPAPQQLRLYLGDKLPKAFVDSSQIRQILSNLITNAHEATASGGEVSVSTDYIIVDHRSPHFEVPFGQYVRIVVRDTGIGMDEETKRRCFEPFFTTKNVDPMSGLGMSGSGLGLAAAYALAKRNGGSLTVESRVGQGTAFTLYLPVTTPMPISAPTASIPLKAELELGAVMSTGEPRESTLSERVERVRTLSSEKPMDTLADILLEEGESFDELVEKNQK